MDVGCGDGSAIQRLSKIGWEVCGVDFDSGAVAAASSKGLNVKQGSLQDLHLPDESLDVISLSHVIEHLSNPQATMEEIYRILKPGGKMFIATPNEKSLLHKMFKSNWFALDPPRHLFIFNPKILRELATKAGFKNMQIRTTVRGGAGIFVGSMDIKKSGHYDMSRSRGFLENIAARIVEYVEWLLSLFNKDLGEEIVLIATK